MANPIDTRVLHNEDVYRTYSANYWKAITVTSPTASIYPQPRGIYVGTGGTLVCSGSDGVGASFTNIPNGAVLPIQPITIQSGSTTCSDIIALY